MIGSRQGKPRRKDAIELSKLVSHALRHEPWLYELEVDDEGWVPVDSVLAALKEQREEWSALSEADLVYMIEASTKRRHEIDDGRIRALYGHSIPGKLKKAPAVPPELLFHGTAPDVVSLIRSSGLVPMGRQYVHLSVDESTAFEVGRCKAQKPTILRIAAVKAHDRGTQFYEGNERVWLADLVPSEFLLFDLSTVS